MRLPEFTQRRFLSALGAALLVVAGVVAVASSAPAPATAAELDLGCSATTVDGNVLLEWTASEESPSVNVRQALDGGETKWRLTTTATTAELETFAFGQDAEYLVRYRLDAGVQDVSCEEGVAPPPPPPAVADCIQVEIGGDEAYLSWEDFGGSRTAVRRGTVDASKWVVTVEGNSATVAAGETYIVRSGGQDVACEQLLDVDADPDFSCSLLPRFTTQMQLVWSDDGEGSHQVRRVNLAAFEDEFYRTGRDNVLDVPVGPLYFIRRDTGDTPCLPTVDGESVAPCVIADQPRSVALDAADCAALTDLIGASVFPDVDNPCNVLLRCVDRQVTALELDLGGGAVPDAVGDLTGVRSLVLRNASGTLPASITGLDLYELTIGGSVDLPDMSALGRVNDLRFEGSVPADNLDTLDAKNVVVAELNGPIPAELGTIQGIKRLTIAALDETVIPQGLIVDTLRELRVSGAGVTGSLPELNGLQVLDLSNTSVSGSIPDSYATSSLRSLALAGTDVSGQLPDFGQARKLTSLNIGNADLTGVIPSGLGSSTSLVRIDLRGNALTGEIPSELADILTLRSLDLRKNQLTGELPASFGSLSGDFGRLDLSGNGLTGTIPASWGALAGTNLRDGFSSFEIDLADNGLVGPLPEFTGEEILVFDLTGNALEGDITQAAAHGEANDINFRWADGEGGNNCLTVTDADLAAALDAAQPGWDRCD